MTKVAHKLGQFLDINTTPSQLGWFISTAFGHILDQGVRFGGNQKTGLHFFLKKTENTGKKKGEDRKKKSKSGSKINIAENAPKNAALLKTHFAATPVRNLEKLVDLRIFLCIAV